MTHTSYYMTYMHDSGDWLDKHVSALAHVQRDVAQSVVINPWAMWKDTLFTTLIIQRKCPHHYEWAINAHERMHIPAKRGR